MKKIKNLSTPRLVSALMALLLFFTAFASFGIVKAEAATEQTNYSSGYAGDIYYFYDLYPTLKPTDVETYFSTNNVNYERNHINEQEFTSMVHQHYFSSVASEQVVVIDIKSFEPNLNLLDQLFSDLKDDGFTTCFISTLPEYIFTVGIVSDVDFYFETDLIRLKNFVMQSFEDATRDKHISVTSDVTILLDNNLIDLNKYQNESLDDLCAVSPYLRFVLKRLVGDIFIEQPDPVPYSEIASDLHENNVQLLVYTGSEFVNLIAPEPELDFESPYTTPEYLDNGFAIGFWQLEDLFHYRLYELNQEYPNFPIYIFEAELIEYVENGMNIISDTDLAETYRNYEISKDEEFLEAFQEFLDSID